MSILTCEISEDGVAYELDLEWSKKFPEDKGSTERSRVKDTFLRAGNAMYPNIDQLMQRLRNQDDVIGIDSFGGCYRI